MFLVNVIIYFKESVRQHCLKEYRQPDNTFIRNLLQKTKTAKGTYDLLQAALDNVMSLFNLCP